MLSDPVEAAMTEINREEMHARLEASEARVATAATDMRAELKTAVTDMRGELKSGLSGMRHDMETGLSGMRHDMDTGLSGMRHDMEAGLSEIRADMERMRGSMETMRADIHQMFSAQTKWIVIIVFGALATGGTIWGFLKPSNLAPSMQSVPFVIYAQPIPAQTPPAAASDSRL